MKYSRKNVERKVYAIPNIKFEQQQLTSFAGLVILRPFLTTLGLTAGLAGCFRHLRAGKVYGRATVFLQLIVHLLLGYRDLRDSNYYRDAPMVKRVLGLKRLPDVATVIALDNNASERAMRHVVIGRKNWTFAGSEAGGHWAATIFSVVVTCRSLSLDPFVYLRDVIDRLPRGEDPATLLPAIWKAAQLSPTSTNTNP